MSRTPVVTSGEVKVRVASHLSKVPSIATEAFTLNLIVLCGGGEIAKTGACAWASDGRKAAAARSGRSAEYFIFMVLPFLTRSLAGGPLDCARKQRFQPPSV